MQLSARRAPSLKAPHELPAKREQRSDAGQAGRDRWISHTAAATVARPASVVGDLSYSHMRQLA